MLLNGSAHLLNRNSLAVFANDRIFTEPDSDGEVMGDCRFKPPAQKADGSFESFCELVYVGLEDLSARSELFFSYGNEYWQFKKTYNMLSKERKQFLISDRGFDKLKLIN